jgi:hypothetical protein
LGWLLGRHSPLKNPTLTYHLTFCCRAIATPLFHENPAALAFLDLSKDTLLPVEEVAKAMMALLTNDKYPPGTVLEVGDVGLWREVGLLNDSGPKGRATVTSRKEEAVEGVKRILEGEREGGKLGDVDWKW